MYSSPHHYPWLSCCWLNENRSQPNQLWQSMQMWLQRVNMELVGHCETKAKAQLSVTNSKLNETFHKRWNPQHQASSGLDKGGGLSKFVLLWA